MPRMGARVVADMFMSYTSDKKMLESLQRVRGLMNVMFLSAMVTAAYGKSLEQSMTDPTDWECIQSTYDFPLECPMEAD